jgi:hypothetical protein
MTLRWLALAGACFTLSACSMAEYFQNYQVPTGWAHSDGTPISTPHGYNKTPAQEAQVTQIIDVDREAWRNGIASAIMPISSVLDMNQPVAVVAEPPLSALNASAANYTADLMVEMSYLVTRPTETTQHVVVEATRTGDPKDNLVKLQLAIVRDGIKYAQRTIDIVVPPQAAENKVWPDFTFIDRDRAPPARMPDVEIYNN